MGYYRRLSWDWPSPTVVTSPTQKGTMFVHPEDTRPLSVQEYKRIQGFPDDWKIIGKTPIKYRLIGDAVPIHLSHAIAMKVYTLEKWRLIFELTSIEKSLDEAHNKREDIQRAILNWARNNLRDFPWRENRTPYRILVAEFLLKRTTAQAVSRIYDRFIERYPGIEELAESKIVDLEGMLQTIGYHKVRAKELVKTANFILREFDGEVPKNLTVLNSIPNIGPYTAGAIRSLGYNEKEPMVDSNVERILKRVFMKSLPEKVSTKKLRLIADVLVPSEKHSSFNLALLDLGANICSYRKTNHNECPLRSLCDVATETYN